jgi:predicted lysophospholipase L1 biosynthesis ABC-type transport system permease subunit
MLAIFDTQVLSVFRRQKEIGTYIALGYTRKEVVTLFTVEGSMHAVLAALLAGSIRDAVFTLAGQRRLDHAHRFQPVWNGHGTNPLSCL